jgi:hypothetical protein
MVPESQSTAGPNDQIVITLPTNALIDLRTLSLAFKVKTEGPTGKHVILPKHIESIFTNISVEANGQVISNGPSRMLEQVHKLLADFQYGHDADYRRSIYQNGDLGIRGFLKDNDLTNKTEGPYILETGMDVHNSNAYDKKKHNDEQFLMTNFLGFLECRPEVLSTAHLGTVKIYLRLAPVNVLIAGGTDNADQATTAASASYSLKDIRFSCKSISIDDGLFQQLIDKRVNSGGLEYIFPEYKVFTTGLRSVNGAMRVSVNAQSLDWLAAYFLPDDYQNKKLNGFLGSSNWFTRESGEAQTSHFTVMGIPMPSYPADPGHEVFNDSLGDMGLINDTDGGLDVNICDKQSWSNAFWVHFLRFDYPTSSEDRIVSGLDTRGQTQEIVWQVAGGNDEKYPVVITKQTSILRVLPLRVLDVVQ